MLLDGLTDWCLTPWERTIKHNQEVIKQYLEEKFKKHAKWRETNRISESAPTIYHADLLLADKKNFGESDAAIDELVMDFFGFAIPTASAATQLLYQLIKHPKEKRAVMRELEKALCSMGKAEREELDV